MTYSHIKLDDFSDYQDYYMEHRSAMRNLDETKASEATVTRRRESLYNKRRLILPKFEGVVNVDEQFEVVKSYDGGTVDVRGVYSDLCARLTNDEYFILIDYSAIERELIDARYVTRLAENACLVAKQNHLSFVKRINQDLST